MRITELLEGKNFDDLQFVKHHEDGGREVDYDLPDDLVFFMNNDDDVFRRIVYPSVSRCVDRIDANQKTNPSLFTNAVKESYKQYVKKYPIRELPDNIEEELCKETCKKMYEEICKNHSEGKYKD
jgi:hypothetical protein